MTREPVPLPQGEENEAPGGRFFFLFMFLLVDIVLYPYAGDRGLRFQLLRAIAFFVTLASVYAVSFRRSTWIIALIFALPVFWHRVLAMERGDNKLALVGLLVSFSFDVFILIAVFRTRVVTSSTIFGAVSIYLLAGFAFTRLYQFLAAVQPGAFYLNPVLNHHTVLSRSDLVYYSFGVMTSLGAAGIAPVSGQARSFTVIEAILGILYLGVLVSRLIAMYVPQIPQSTSQKS